MSAKLIQVIVAEVTKGRGTDPDPVRRVVEYYTTDGELLARVDDWKEEQDRNELARLRAATADE